MSNYKLETSLVLPVTAEFIERRIFIIRRQKVMLDRDLADLYQVPTKVLNQAVQRNINRFPGDFMFKLALSEAVCLKSQIVTSKAGRGGRRKLPSVFNELGVAMLSSVLKSDRAVQMNIYIMRAFVKLREMLATNADLARKIAELEKGQKEHTKDLVIVTVAIRKLMDAHKPLKSAIGFQSGI